MVKGHYCKDCKWFDLTTFEDGDVMSWCNRYPPVYVGPPVNTLPDERTTYEMGYWEEPPVAILHSCGEWTPKTGTECDVLRKMLENALIAVESKCTECAYSYECRNSQRCIAVDKIRSELSGLGMEV